MMKGILRASRHVVVVAVLGCIVMFGAVTLYGAAAVALAVLQMVRGGASLAEVATVTVVAFKILDLFLLGAILYIVALGLGALFLGTETALPAWFEVRELQDLKIVLSQSVIVVMLVNFLGDVLEWEKGSDIVFVGGGIAMVIAAVAFMLRGLPARDRRLDADGARR
jgi:uncharacterized membrane protein YqhA